MAKYRAKNIFTYSSVPNRRAGRNKRQVGKFLKNTKRAEQNRRAGQNRHAGQNRRTGGKFSGKSKTCRGKNFWKINNCAAFPKYPKVCKYSKALPKQSQSNPKAIPKYSKVF